MNAAKVNAATIAAFNALPTLERDAIKLVFYCNLVEREAAQLLGVTRNRFSTVLKSALKKLKCQWSPEPVSAVFNATDSQIEAAMDLLPALERLAIQLMYYDGLHERDAAKQLGVTPDKLRTVFNTGLHNLKTQFNVVP